MSIDAKDEILHFVGNSREWLDNFLSNADKVRQIISIVAIGSAVRDRVHRRSDLDLLVLYQSSQPFVESPGEVDIRWVDIEKVKELVGRGHEIVNWALMYGICLFDTAGTWGKMQATWEGRIPLPSVADAKIRAQKCLIRAEEMMEAGDEFAADDLIFSSLTQLARARLIGRGAFPASRTELPVQLRKFDGDDSLANLLETAMFGKADTAELLEAALGIAAELDSLAI